MAMTLDNVSFVVFLTILISISINYIFLNYVDNLERIGCECSQNWKSKYIKFYSTYLIVMQTFIIISDVNTLLKLIKTILPLYFISQLAGLLYIYSLYQYSSSLKELQCKCSNKWERELMYYYSIIILITLLIIFVINLIYLTRLLYRVTN
jgi:hypothetical protein